MTLSAFAREALAIVILKDLRISQTTASSIAGRIKTDIKTTTAILTDLITAGNAETDTIGNTIIVYRITPQGLELIS